MLGLDQGDNHNPLSPTLDHVVAKAAGGKGKDNYRLACFECNGLRGEYNTGLWKQTTQRDQRELAKINQTVIKLKTRLLGLEEINAKLVTTLLDYLDQPFWYRIFGKFFGNKLRNVPVPEISGIIVEEKKL